MINGQGGVAFIRVANISTRSKQITNQSVVWPEILKKLFTETIYGIC